MKRLTVMCAAACALLLPALAPAQDLVQTAGKNAKVVLDNADVRVIELNMPAGASTGMHEHKTDQLVVFLTGGIGGKELLEDEAVLGQRHRLARGARAGQPRQCRILRGGDQVWRRARGNGEARTCGFGILQVLRLAHGADTDDRAVDFIGDRAHRIERGARAQRDLDGGNAAGDQCTREAHRVLGVFDHHHRHHRGDVQYGFEQAHLVLQS